MSDQTILILNALGYFLLAFFLIKKKKSKLSIYVSVIWAVAAIFSIIFYQLNTELWEWRIYRNLASDALVFIFICVLLCIIPLTKLEDRSSISIKGNYDLLTIFSWVIILLSIFPFLANVNYALSHLSMSVSSLADNYGEEVEVLSGTLAVLNKYGKYCRTFAPILIFYFLQRPNKNPVIIGGLFFSFFNSSLGSFNGGSRYVFAADILYLAAIYCIFSNSLETKIRRTINFYGAIAVSLLLFVFMTISIYRATTNLDSEEAVNDVTSSFGLYIGEGMLNFSNTMWGMSTRLNGANTLSVVQYFKGEQETTVRDGKLVSFKAGIPLYIYYTFVGDFYIDFGLHVTFAIFIGFFIALSLLIRRNCVQISFYTMVWLGLLLRIIVVGFTYFVFMNTAMELIYVPILNVVLCVLDKMVSSN